jgi:CheY-like chemotaxis protein
MVKDALIEDLILLAPDIEGGCRNLLDTANANGGKDNITLILAALHYTDSKESAESDVDRRTQYYFTLTNGLMPPVGFQPHIEGETGELVTQKLPALEEQSLPERIDTPFSTPVPTVSEFPALPPVPTVTITSKDRLLIVDSDSQRLPSFEAMLSPYYEVLTATDGEEGLAKAITESPRLVIASVELAKIGGVSICQALKANERFRHIPIVLISRDYTDKEHIIQGLSTGADEYLTLPIDERELLLRVKPHIEKTKLLESLRYDSAVNEATSIQLHQEMETVAKARQDIFQNILDVSSDGVLILDPAGWVTAVNRTFETFHRINREQVIGFGYRALLKKIQFLYENGDRQLQRFIELINNPEMIVDDEVKVRNEKQMVIKIHRYSAPVRDDSGGIYGRFFIFRNLIM